MLNFAGENVESYMTKEQRYIELLPQIEAVTGTETDRVANMANIAALLHCEFGFWWTGFYVVSADRLQVVGEKELVLGPFQGPVACTRIRKGRGVCGTSWLRKETVIVPDVHRFEGHIACSSESNSEIVVPVIKDDDVVAVLDIDSKEFDTFDQTDKQYLERVAQMLGGIWQ